MKPIAKSDSGSIKWLEDWPSSCLLFSESQLQEVVKLEREKVAKFVLKHGFATGHGDTIEDLLDELDWQMTDRNNRLGKWHRISDVIRTADNSTKYSGLHVIFNGIDVGSIGNLLVEMTPLPVLERPNEKPVSALEENKVQMHAYKGEL